MIQTPAKLGRATTLVLPFPIVVLAIAAWTAWPSNAAAPPAQAAGQSSPSVAAPTFGDVPFDHPFYRYIEALYQAGYTAGCNTGPLMYCPDQTMNRAQSAVYVERGIHSTSFQPPAPTSQIFADLPLDSWAAAWVNSLWLDHYTAGCGTSPLIYCPWQGHTRAEGAVFYLRMLNGAEFVPPDPSTQIFADVPLDAWYAKWVQAAYAAGLLPACQTAPDLRFCPNDPLTRAMAAYMMVRAKGLELPPDPAAGDWPQLQHDSRRSGYTSSTNVSSPYRITWRFHPPSPHVSISGRVQPVVAGGIVCAGYYDGKMYCLDRSTGQLAWSFATGGPITHTAAIGDGKVFFGSQDGYVYAVDAASGQLAWKYGTNAGIQNAPCISGPSLYIGSSDGNLYALETATGTERWVYRTGVPIYTSAACTPTAVYFGNESVQAFALDARNGTLLWKKQLRGQSMAGYWPVVAEQSDVVFFRTQPMGGFHAVLASGDDLLSGLPGAKTPENVALEQNTIRDYLNGSGNRWKTFWALDLATGDEQYTAPILYTSGEGAIPVPPVVDDANGRGWVVWRTRYSTFFSIGVRCCIDLGKLDLRSGSITHFRGPLSGYVHLVGDENDMMAAYPGALLISGRGMLYGVDLHSEANFYVANSLRAAEDDFWNGDVGPFAFDSGAGWPKGSILGGGGAGAGYISSPAIGADQLFWVARYGMVVAIGRQ